MTLYESMQTNPVSDLPVRSAICCKAENSIHDAILKMREGQLGCVVITDDDQKPVGIFNEAMIRQLLAKGELVLDQPLSDHMATTVPWVNESDPVEIVLDAMEMKNVRFVVVVNKDGAVTGLTGQKGLMEYVAEYFPGEVMVQRVGSKPFPGTREGA